MSPLPVIVEMKVYRDSLLKDGIILVVTGILGGGTTQEMHGILRGGREKKSLEIPWEFYLQGRRAQRKEGRFRRFPLGRFGGRSGRWNSRTTKWSCISVFVFFSYFSYLFVSSCLGEKIKKYKKNKKNDPERDVLEKNEGMSIFQSIKLTFNILFCWFLSSQKVSLKGLGCPPSQ